MERGGGQASKSMHRLISTSKNTQFEIISSRYSPPGYQRKPTPIKMRLLRQHNADRATRLQDGCSFSRAKIDIGDFRNT